MTAATTLPRTDTPRLARRRGARDAISALGSTVRRMRAAITAIVEAGQLGAPADVEISRLTGGRI